MLVAKDVVSVCGPEMRLSSSSQRSHPPAQGMEALLCVPHAKNTKVLIDVAIDCKVIVLGKERQA